MRDILLRQGERHVSLSQGERLSQGMSLRRAEAHVMEIWLDVRNEREEYLAVIQQQGRCTVAENSC